MPVTVVTAASGTYEDTLRSEIEKAQEAPDPVPGQRPRRPEHLERLLPTTSPAATFYGELTSDDLRPQARTAQVLGVAYVIETYGLIVQHSTLLAEYARWMTPLSGRYPDRQFREPQGRRRGHSAPAKDELGVLGAFTSAGMDASSDWRFKTHLANLPIYYEYQDRRHRLHRGHQGHLSGQLPAAIWDLYINNATCEPATELTAQDRRTTL